MLRLRYEVSRKFARYIGYAYGGKYGNTARYSRQAGETTSDYRFVFGLDCGSEIRLRIT